MSHLMTKPTKWDVRPVKTQISLGIRPVWSESLLSAKRKLGPLVNHWVPSEDSDQTGLMPRLIWLFAARTSHFVGFVMCRFINVLFQWPKIASKSHNFSDIVCFSTFRWPTYLVLVLFTEAISNREEIPAPLLVELPHICFLEKYKAKNYQKYSNTWKN